jgi:hypothetical protein
MSDDEFENDLEKRIISIGYDAKAIKIPNWIYELGEGAEIFDLKVASVPKMVENKITHSRSEYHGITVKKVIGDFSGVREFPNGRKFPFKISCTISTYALEKMALDNGDGLYYGIVTKSKKAYTFPDGIDRFFWELMIMG